MRNFCSYNQDAVAAVAVASLNATMTLGNRSSRLFHSLPSLERARAHTPIHTNMHTDDDGDDDDGDDLGRLPGLKNKI